MSEPTGIEQKLETPRRRMGIEPGALLVALAAVVFVAARFWHLTSYGLFGDEVFAL